MRKIAIIFLSSICFVCSKEPSHRDSSFEYAQHMFWLRNKKNNFQLRTLILGPELSDNVIETSYHYFLTGEVDLQGQVKMYTVKVYSNLRNYTEDYGAEESSVVFDNLTPNTVYTVTVTITIFGGASITSDPATATTLDGGKDRDSFNP